MSQTLMSQLVKYEGACCIYGYYRKNSEKPAWELAKHLGVSEATVRVWRKRIREGTITCGYGVSGVGECLHKHENTPQNTP